MTESEFDARERLLSLLMGDPLGIAKDLVLAAGIAARETRTPRDVDAYADALSDLHTLRCEGLSRISYIEGIAVGAAMARHPEADLDAVEQMARTMLSATLTEGGSKAAMIVSDIVDGIARGLIRASAR